MREFYLKYVAQMNNKNKGKLPLFIDTHFMNKTIILVIEKMCR